MYKITKKIPTSTPIYNPLWLHHLPLYQPGSRWSGRKQHPPGHMNCFYKESAVNHMVLKNTPGLFLPSPWVEVCSLWPMIIKNAAKSPVTPFPPTPINTKPSTLTAAELCTTWTIWLVCSCHFAFTNKTDFTAPGFSAQQSVALEWL